MYPEEIVAPMRAEAVAMGCEELRTAAAVDAALKDSKGTALVFINSICGCAAGTARPGLHLALYHTDVKPDHVYTVFAGNDVDAVATVRRNYFVGMPPSSPAMGLLRDGKLVAMVHRHDIEGSSAQEVAQQLIKVFQQHCKPATATA